MRQHPQQTFGLLRGPAPRPQGRTQAPLVTRDRTLDLPALAVNSSEEAPFHLSAVFGAGPRPGSSLARGDDGLANAQGFSAKHVVVFGVIAGVRQEAIKMNVLGGLNHGRGKLRRVLRRAEAHESPGQQMALPMANEGEFRPVKPRVALMPTAPDVVAAHVAALQPRGIDDAVGTRADQRALVRPLKDDRLEKNEGVFFRSLRSAYERVE